MKITSLLILVVALCGCSTRPQDLPIQQILSVVLPADFTGNYHLQHQNAANIGIDILFTGLRWDAEKGLWVWTGMVYDGHSPWTATKAQATPTPKPLN